jgi:hypothetical protein
MEKIKNFGLYLIVPLAFIIGLIWFSGQTVKDNQSALGPKNPIIGITESRFNFNDVSIADGVIKHYFLIKNASAEPVVITKIYTSCMCTSAEIKVGFDRKGPFGMPGHGFTPPVDLTVNPGEEGQLIVTFDPAAHGPAGVGKIERSIFIEAKNYAPVEFRISANVTP